MEELAAAAAAAAGDAGDDGDADGGVGDGEDDDGPSNEYVHVNENYYFLEYVIRALGVTHALVSFCMLIAYYNLKVKIVFLRNGNSEYTGSVDGIISD